MGASPLEILVKDYSWIHTGLGLIGNLFFFIGSILFLPAFDQLQTQGVWLFIAGSLLMLIGSLGDAAVKAYDNKGA